MPNVNANINEHDNVDPKVDGQQDSENIRRSAVRPAGRRVAKVVERGHRGSWRAGLSVAGEMFCACSLDGTLAV